MPPGFVRNVAWFLKHGKQHWRLLLGPILLSVLYFAWKSRSDFKEMMAEPRVKASVTLRSDPAGADASEASALRHPDMDVVYTYSRSGETIAIRYESAYLDRLRAGAEVEGLTYNACPFSWAFPELSFIVSNNSEEVVVLTEAVIEVGSSEPRDEVILVVDHHSLRSLFVTNWGWAEVVQPHLFLRVPPEGQNQLQVFAEFECPLESFGDFVAVPLSADFLGRPELHCAVPVIGTIEHGPPGERQHFRFSTEVLTESLTGHAMGPSSSYDILLNAGDAPLVRRVPISHEILPGRADHITIRVGADRTANFDLWIELSTGGTSSIYVGHVSLDVFVPRGAWPKGKANER